MAKAVEKADANNLRKKDVVKELAGRTEYNIKDVKEVINAYHGLIKETLMKGEEISLSGVGVFKVRQRKARQGYNPITKAKIQIPERKAIKFKPTKEIKLELKK